MSFSPARRAFTLIEILVVLGVLVLLSALIFPVASRVREVGRRTTCTSNMRQLGLAFQQYTQDASGKYPASGDYYSPNSGTECFAATCTAWEKGNGHWVAGEKNKNLAAPGAPYDYVDGAMAQPEAGALFPYVKETSMYYCPSNRDGAKKKLSYSMNCALTLLDSRRVRTPADIVLLVDEEYANDGYFYAVDHKLAGAPSNPSTDALTQKHNGGGNLLFADGHVDYFRSSDFALDDTPAGLANKWKTSGSPRFHDKSFGKWGSSIPTQRPPEIATDYCNAKAGPGNATGTAN